MKVPSKISRTMRFVKLVSVYFSSNEIKKKVIAVLLFHPIVIIKVKNYFNLSWHHSVTKGGEFFTCI